MTLCNRTAKHMELRYEDENPGNHDLQIKVTFFLHYLVHESTYYLFTTEQFY